MRHRLSPLPLVLAVFALTLVFAGAAAAAAPPTTGGDSPPVVTPASPTVAVDKVLVKLNALEDQLDAMTLKLDATTAKLDALSAKTQNIWETTHFTKGYIQNGLPTIIDLIDVTCHVGQEIRDYQHSNLNYARIWNCR